MGVQHKPPVSRVLVVDDQKGVRRLLEEALKFEGIDVEAVGNGEEALEKVAVNRYALILLDVKMPGMNGLEVLAAFRERGLVTPVWLMTAYGELAAQQKAGEMGVARYVVKPFNVLELIRSVRQFLSPVMSG
ncbi:MAG: response regulator [Heliobacteriaceae bacterium]|nr:response regulator [Heliobacteriaceae bacterium]